VKGDGDCGVKRVDIKGRVDNVKCGGREEVRGGEGGRTQ